MISIKAMEIYREIFSNRRGGTGGRMQEELHPALFEVPVPTYQMVAEKAQADGLK